MKAKAMVRASELFLSRFYKKNFQMENI